MSLIKYLLNLFVKPNPSGLILDDPSLIESLPWHEFFAGGFGEPVDWSQYCPPFRYQGSSMWCTAFSGSSIGHIFEKKEKGASPLFSPLELFYRSGGQVFGNSLINAALAMANSFVLESDIPTPTPTAWSPDLYASYAKAAKATDQELTSGKQYALKPPASVKTDKTSLRMALATSPLMLAIGIGRGYWNDPAPMQTSYSAYHAVVLVDIDQDGCYVIFDSLTYKQGFSGFHRLAADYEILYALSFIDLPDDWQDIQSKQKAVVHSGALDHYGFSRDLNKEQQAAQSLSLAVKQNPTISAFIGREWTVAVNAVAYGNYSVQDLLNHYTNIRRTGKPIFDLNSARVR